MKKKFSYLLLSLLILPCLVLFSGCGDGEDPQALTPLTENMITLDYTSTIYSAEEKTPAVTVRLDGQTIDENNYTVQYKNNLNVGTAKVVVTASKNSKLISGSATRTFSITRISKTVSNFEQLKATLADTNYVSIYADGNINVPAGETLEINQGVSLSLSVFNLNNNGTIINNGTLTLNNKPTGIGTITNNSILTAYVGTRSGFLDALTFANKIILSDSITGGVNTLESIEISGETKLQDVTIDLNGKNLETNIIIKGDYTNKVSVRLTNGSSIPSTIGTENHNYGLTVLGNGNSNFNIQLNNLNFVGYQGGIATDVQYGSGVITATKCTFEGKNFGDSDLSTTCVGAYLPAYYGYTFKNCTFIGYTAYYAQSGVHRLTNCTFEAKGTAYHEPSVSEKTGSAIVINSSTNSQLKLTMYFSGATIKSECGYGVEEYSDSANVYADITLAEVIKFKTSKDNYIFEHDVFTDEIVEEED